MDKNWRAYMAELVGTFALVFVGASLMSGGPHFKPDGVKLVHSTHQAGMDLDIDTPLLC